jgi:TolA-binding protein
MRRASLVAALALCSNGCFLWTSAGEGEGLRTDVNSQGDRLQKLEQAQTAQLEQLKLAEAKAQKSIEDLESMIERATTVVQRNSADVTVSVSELQTKVAVLDGRLAELEHALEQIKSQAAAVSPTQGGQDPTGAATPPAEQVPADKTEHFAAAYRAYSERDFTKARSLFRSYIERYRTDAQADNAQYWIGASYLVENRPATALAELRKVIENHRSGDAIDEALLDMAEAFYRLRACSDAKTTLDTLIKTQNTSSLVDKAKQKLKDVKKAPKDYCTS